MNIDRMVLTTLVAMSLGVFGCEQKQAAGTPALKPSSEAPASESQTMPATSAAEPSPTKQESASSSEVEETRAVHVAQATLAPFKKQLKETLMAALAEGPEKAIDVCREVAPKLAAQASSPEVEVGRSALKLRNPNNAPRSWLKPVLSEFAALGKPEGQHRVVPLAAGGYGYAETIVLGQPCMLCHGTAISAPIAKRISEQYPNDQATGFSLGDLRGVFWAEVHPAALTPSSASN